MKKKNALPIKWMLGILIVLIVVSVETTRRVVSTVPTASNPSSQNNFFQFLGNMIGIRHQQEPTPAQGHAEGSGPNFAGAPGAQLSGTGVAGTSQGNYGNTPPNGTELTAGQRPNAVQQGNAAGNNAGINAGNISGTNAASNPVSNAGNNPSENPGNLPENNAGINAQNGSASNPVLNAGNNPGENPGNLPQSGSEGSSGGSAGGSSGGSNPENLSQGGLGNNSESNSGSNSGGYAGCVLGCYPGCNPGCDPACKPSVCNFGNTSGNTSGSASGSASGSTSGSTSGSINQYYLPTINPIPTDAQVSLSVAQQNQQNDKVAALVATHQALALPVQQQAQASKYQTINPDNIPAPSTSQAPDDVVAKIKSTQIVPH